MPIPHLFLALGVMAIWGTNFVTMRWVLDEVTPLTFASLRFFLVSLPFIFYIPRPAIPLQLLIGYGLTAFSMQFSFIFLAVWFDMPVGLVSLVVQSQVFFTLLLVLFIHQVRPTVGQVVGVCLGASGIAWVGFDLEQSMPLLAFGATLLAALGWSIGNTFIKSMGPVSALPLVIWASLVSALSLAPLSFVLEGIAPWQRAAELLLAGDTVFWGSLFFNALGASLLGYGGWAWLLRRHPAAVVAPFTLLVPVFGMGSAALLLGEAIRPTAWPGIILVFLGLTLTQLRFKRQQSSLR
jgi:O-acetylserine/cysteine efflux transporter